MNTAAVASTTVAASQNANQQENTPIDPIVQYGNPRFDLRSIGFSDCAKRDARMRS
jgi:predicted membrane-bound mannosyltransferase